MNILKKACLTSVGIIFCGLVYGQSKPKLNVLVVVIDDIGPAWLPPYAKHLKPEDMEPAVVNYYAKQQKTDIDIITHIETAKKSMPFLNSLSSKAVIFNRAFATSSICAPSRAGMLTAKYQESWGAYNLEDMAQTGVPLDQTMLPSLFKENGYNNAVIGKWHLGITDKTTINNPAIDARHKRSSCDPLYNPLNRGFDYYFGYNSSESKYLKSDDLWENFNPIPTLEDEFLTEKLNSKVVDFIEQSLDKKKPFFVYYAPMTIHGSLTEPPAKYKSKFNSGVNFTDKVAGHLNALDEGLKDIFETLKKYSQENNTLIIVCSDNGPSNPALPYSAPFKGGKGSGYLGGSHVPMIMILPSKTQQIMVNNNVSTLDIMPTALDIAGIQIPKNLDGVSLKKIVLENDKSFIPHEYLFSSGSHALSWSLNYFDGKTPIESIAVKDRKVCPNYLWGMKDNEVFFQLSTINKGAYDFLPNGLPTQKFFFNLKSDSQQNINLYKGDNKSISKLEAKTKAWLKANKEPVVYNKEAFKILVEQ